MTAVEQTSSGFDSLQTGNHIASDNGDAGSGEAKEFRFPSNGKPEHKRGKFHTHYEAHLFRFPSNGKPEHKTVPDLPGCFSARSFLFPSNGNAYRKKKLFRRTTTGRDVSIPFKRERTAQGGLTNTQSSCYSGFHSLQTGMHIQSLTHPERYWFRRFQFPFPSNGNAYRKYTMQSLFVCVPWFRFPSNGNAYPKRNPAREIGRRPSVSIPFKREGGYKAWLVFMISVGVQCFHSLQTGRRIQRQMLRTSLSGVCKGFHSLQTGTHITSVYRF